MLNITIGGCSVTNGMMYMRGHKKDYDDWEKSGARGWAWKDVLPFFKVSEDNRQIGTLVSSEFHSSGGYLTTQRVNIEYLFMTQNSV